MLSQLQLETQHSPWHVHKWTYINIQLSNSAESFCIFVVFTASSCTEPFLLPPTNIMCVPDSSLIFNCNARLLNKQSKRLDFLLDLSVVCSIYTSQMKQYKLLTTFKSFRVFLTMY